MSILFVISEVFGFGEDSVVNTMRKELDGVDIAASSADARSFTYSSESVEANDVSQHSEP